MRSDSARALSPNYDPANFSAPAAANSRNADSRQRWRWGGALAASLLIVVMLAVSLQMPTAYATAKGEIHTVPLGNGATVTLNTDTRIEIHDAHGSRRIRLLRGEVLIEGASASFPTRVEVDGKHLEASSATFLVRKLEGRPAEVLVQDGHVLLAGTTQSPPLPVAPNTSASLPEGDEWQLNALSLGQMSRELAWREGKIALQGETLAEAVSLYARYSDTPIEIVDPHLARMPVTGLFAINNPLGFSRAVADVFGAQARQDGDRIVIDRRL